MMTYSNLEHRFKYVLLSSFFGSRYSWVDSNLIWFVHTSITDVFSAVHSNDAYYIHWPLQLTCYYISIPLWRTLLTLSTYHHLHSSWKQVIVNVQRLTPGSTLLFRGVHTLIKIVTILRTWVQRNYPSFTRSRTCGGLKKDPFFSETYNAGAMCDSLDRPDLSNEIAIHFFMTYILRLI